MSGDPVTRMLQRLPEIAPDEARAERVRARCRAAIAAQATSRRENSQAPRKTTDAASAIAMTFGAPSLGRSE